MASDREAVAMAENDPRLAYVGRRAYELARSGYHEDFASIQLALMREGYADGVAWLELPGVMAALAEICAIAREGSDSGIAARASEHGSSSIASCYITPQNGGVP
jgi:hypothetical protein